jgi:DNA polymerase
VAHVHDEVIIEAPTDMPVETITEIMGHTPEWIRGLELHGDGFEAKFYQK